MKIKLTQMALCVAATTAFGATNAQIYYGLGYTQNSKSDAADTVFRAHALNLGVVESLKAETTALDGMEYGYETNNGITAMVGFPIKNNFSIEARYTYFKDWIDAKYAVTGKRLVEVEAEEEGGESSLYETDFRQQEQYQADAHKIGLHGVYRHSLNSVVYAKGAVGITYTTSDLKGTYTTMEGGETVSVDSKDMKSMTGIGSKVERDQTNIEATIGIGFRITSRCNVELDYNTSKDQESATAQLVWRW